MRAYLTTVDWSRRLPLLLWLLAGLLIALQIAPRLGDGSWHNWKIEILFYAKLPGNIKSLYHQDFVSVFPEWSLGRILSELIHREVYSDGVFHTEQIRFNATDDLLIEFENYLYTESELLLYAMVSRLSILQVGVIVVPTGVATSE